MPKPSRFPAFAHRDFRLWWVGRLVSDVGTWVQLATLAGLTAARTGSPLASASVAVAAFCPAALGGPLGGRAVARHSPRRVALVATCGQIVVSLVLAGALFTGHSSLLALLPLIALQGAFAGAVTPALETVLVEVVPSHDLASASGAVAGIWDAGRIVGPLLAAVLAGLQPGWAVVLNAISFAALAVALGAMAGPFAGSGAAPPPFAESVQVARRTPGVREALSAAVRWHVLVVPFMGLVPAVAVHLLGQGSGQVLPVTGVLMAVQGLGAVVGALAVAGWWHRGPEQSRARWAGVVAGLSMVALGWAPSVAGAAACLFFLAAAVKVGTAAWRTVLFQSAPPAWRGPFFGLQVLLVNVTYGAALTAQASMAAAVGLAVVFTVAGATLAIAEPLATRDTYAQPDTQTAHGSEPVP